MNLLLLRGTELNGSRAHLTDYRAEHIIKVLKSKKGDSLTAGILNGKVGSAAINAISSEGVEVEFCPEDEPPAPADVSLILALPRPKAFRRILFAAVSAGVKDIHVINSWRVEKSYWESPYISEESVEKVSVEALSQGKDTMMPSVRFHRFFMQFMEEGLSAVPEHRVRYLAHPYAENTERVLAPAAVAVGPEGGFIGRELDTFEKFGFTPFTALDRVLTTEHFVPFILGKLII